MKKISKYWAARKRRYSLAASCTAAIKQLEIVRDRAYAKRGGGTMRELGFELFHIAGNLAKAAMKVISDV